MFLLRGYGDVRDANEMRTILKGNNYESRIDYTDRDLEGAVKEGWVLLPAVQGRADCAAMSEEMEGYAGTEGGKGEIYRAIWKEENRIKSGVINIH